ncbi:diadenylate cyclase [Mucilaginibacter gynuensis]|uniref:Diadenylate cyclase n=2 Tax=Mucilaginibacter gynuensis TaxID=1302236 RepID=A0ABP8FV44_9SPHI
MVASTIENHFAKHITAARVFSDLNLSRDLSARIIEAVIDVAFWASLRREEGKPPKISMALLHPSQSEQPLLFENRIRLTPQNLIKLAPAVEQPGIHLGIWHEEDDIYIWGTTNSIPGICFVLEVVEPGLLVIKHKRIDGFGKFVNIAILKGDEIKIVDEETSGVGDCPSLLTSLLGLPLPSSTEEGVNVLVELASSMRSHGRGGILLIVPQGSATWRNSIVQPMNYPVTPAYTVITNLMQMDLEERDTLEWQEALLDAIKVIGGFTAVDGATVITDQHELMAFGAKIARSENSVPVEQLIVTEPVVDGKATRRHPAQNGGTRHLAAAQFVHDQHDALALVASQDGHFTVFSWSNQLNLVHAHKIDILLL